VSRNLFWLSDEQWKRIELFLPTDVRGVERVDDRRVISGIVGVEKRLSLVRLPGGLWSRRRRSITASCAGRFRLIVGEIVERLQHQRLEDHDFIPRLASRRIPAFRFAPAKLAFNQRRMQLGPERFERNHRRNRYKRIVLFGETFIASVQIEEAKLSHANLPRSEYENLESDLLGGGKRLFFEVP
jgi:hypothetical protein